MKTRSETTKHICLIYTGGTIGMVRRRHKDQTIITPPKSAKQFLQLLRADRDIREIADVDYVPLMNKDSTNMVPEDWTKMAKAVYQRLGKYDGFVIAHGTDTMHFSASALAFAFGRNLNVPIAFTGAQATPDVPYGDARVNLLRAIKVASQNLAEVVIVFGDFVFRGCRAQKKDEKRFDAFESPAEFPLGYITEDIVLSEFARKRKLDLDPSKLQFQPYFAEGVAQISLIPGFQPDLLFRILEDPACKGIVLQSFGAGNVPNKGKFSFKKFIKRAVEMDKPVVIASQFPANSTLASHYEPGVAAVRAGAIPTGNMTNAAATVKLQWILSRLDEEKVPRAQRLAEIWKRMNHPYVNEVTVSEQVKQKVERRSPFDMRGNGLKTSSLTAASRMQSRSGKSRLNRSGLPRGQGAGRKPISSLVVRP